MSPSPKHLSSTDYSAECVEGVFSELSIAPVRSGPGGWALVLVLIVLIRGRLGYREGAYATDEASAPRVRWG
jgi:hypothetical protein